MHPRSIMPRLAALLLLASPLTYADTGADAPPGTVAALDQKLFDAYNRCDLKTFGGLFDRDVEFYHDHGGVTHTRREVVDNTRRNICGKVRRELVAGSLEVYPVKGYGAMELGEHRFCQSGTQQCEGLARFVIIWRRSGAKWSATRVFSYDHRAADAGADATAPDAATGTVAALDSGLFDAYNRCDLHKFGSYIAADVEFYHDQGGLTLGRPKLVDSVRNNICHKITRALVPGSLQVFVVKGYGAIETGDHTFCQTASGRCEGAARFVHLWHDDGGNWTLSRVLSYDHHAATPAAVTQETH
jgi:hypothetical protein